jgi:hypothetical protein
MEVVFLMHDLSAALLCLWADERLRFSVFIGSWMGHYCQRQFLRTIESQEYWRG